MSNHLISKDDVAKIEGSPNLGNSSSNGNKDISGSPSVPRTLQPTSNSQLSPSFSSTRQRHHFNGKAPATINFGALTQNTNRIPFSEVDSDTDTILRAVTKSQINQSPTLGRLRRSLFNIEQFGNNDKNDNDDFQYNYNFNVNDREPKNMEAVRKKMISAIEKVDSDVKKLARTFGATDTMTAFLAIAKNPKFVTNASKTIPHAKDTFDQLERELRHIRIHSKLPKEIKGANTNVLQRLKSMRQAHTSDLSQTFLQNEFQNYISKTEQMSIFNISNNKNIKTAKTKKNLKSNDNDDLLMIENLKLKAKLASLQKHLLQKMEIEKKSDSSKNFVNLNKPELIIQTQKMLAEIKSKIDLQQNANNSYALQMAEFARKREELIGQFNSSNQQAKRLEIARKRMIDENAKIVTVKGKDYDLKMLDEEISSVFIRTDQIIKNLEQIESKEKKCLESLQSNY